MSKSENRLFLQDLIPEMANEVNSFFNEMEEQKNVHETIFVSLPSYEDTDLVPTIKDLYSKADDETGLHVCVFDQAELTSKDEIFDKKNLTYLHTHTKNTKGVGWARNHIQNFYTNETYFLSLDSHMRFAKGWDTTLKNMYKELKVSGYNPFITNYAPELIYNHEVDLYEDDLKEWCNPISGHWGSNKGCYVYVEKYTNYDGKRAKKNITDDKIGNYFPSPWCSLHFLFTEGKFNNKIRFDPDHFFSGEEYNVTLRAFTHGYDLISPKQHVVYHHYKKDSVKSDPAMQFVNNTQWADLDSKGLFNNKMIFTEEPALASHNYGLGNKRTVDDFVKYMYQTTGKNISVDLD